MNGDVDFFEAEAVRHARTLPLQDARRFLHGLLLAAESAGLERTRAAYTNICLADDQLELIASGQLKLNLGGGNGQS